ncbi:MAG: hypothetical protein M3N39_08070 [Pseudomonadota bacterium]|nr:hypothetical protein [Pseudomonadota bacterium]
MTRTVQWRLHCRSSPAAVFELLTTDAGRELFWAERSRSEGNAFLLLFPDGSEERCVIRTTRPPWLFGFRYFGSEVEIGLASDGKGGTDLTLINTGVPDAEFEDVHAGWLSVLLPLKAAADFDIDLRNHDPDRTWRELYVDQ